MKISIIIPVYNEELTISKIIEKACEAPLPPSVEREVIVVNDGSTDGTYAAIQSLQNSFPVKTISFSRNRGKTAALLAGISASRGDYLLFQDADLEYDPTHYERLLEPVVRGEVSVVFGSRFLGRIDGMNPFIRAANIFNTWSVNLYYSAALTDVNTGYKVISRKLFDQISVSSDGFGGDAELTAKLLRRGAAIKEVPIDYFARPKKDGKKMNWFRAIHMYACFFFHRTAA